MNYKMMGRFIAQILTIGAFFLLPALAISLYYADIGISTIDLGPGTHHGIPNEGLERFKTSLGCSISLKHIIAGHAL